MTATKRSPRPPSTDPAAQESGWAPPRPTVADLMRQVRDVVADDLLDNLAHPSADRRLADDAPKAARHPRAGRGHTPAYRSSRTPPRHVVEMATIPDDDRTPDAPVTPPIGRSDHPSTRKWPSLLFVTLTYTISWAWVIPLAVTGGHGRSRPRLAHPPARPARTAARRDAVHGARRPPGPSRTRRQHAAVADGWRWWLAAISPLLALIVVLGALAISGGDLPAATDVARFSGIPSAWGLVGVCAVIVVIGGLGEEAGWRGYLQPALQQRPRVLPATGLVAVAWAAWHLPPVLPDRDLRKLPGRDVAGVLAPTGRRFGGPGVAVQPHP